jgi:hypothetical protein
MPKALRPSPATIRQRRRRALDTFMARIEAW